MTGDGSVVHRPSRFLMWLVIAVLVFALAGTAVSVWAGVSPWVILVWGLLVLLGIIAVLDIRTMRVEMGPEGLTVVKAFRRQFVPRDEIESVTWGKGVGTSLKLVDGRWVGLPEVGPGSQGLSNSIRAWLDRTAASR